MSEKESALRPVDEDAIQLAADLGKKLNRVWLEELKVYREYINALSNAKDEIEIQTIKKAYAKRLKMLRRLEKKYIDEYLKRINSLNLPEWRRLSK